MRAREKKEGNCQALGEQQVREGANRSILASSKSSKANYLCAAEYQQAIVISQRTNQK